MAILNYIVNKVEIDIKSRNFEKQINVNNSFSMPEVVKLDDNNLQISWTFGTSYADIGEMLIGGTLVYNSGELTNAYEERVPKNAKDKKKRIFLTGESLEMVSNFVVRRGIVETTVLSRFLQLPVPIKLPTVKIDKQGTQPAEIQ